MIRKQYGSDLYLSSFLRNHTVIRFVWVSDKFGTCTVVSVNGTLAEDKMRGFKGESAHFSRNKCPIYTHDRASAKFISNSHETDYRAVSQGKKAQCLYLTSPFKQ